MATSTSGENVCEDAGAKRVMTETDPRLGFWTDRWTSDKIGWHKDDVHHLLLKYTPRIVSNTDEPVKVLVPLCGKTVDLAYLANHEGVSEVYGVDGVRKALEEFSDEHSDLNLTWEDTDTAFEKLTSPKLKLLKGDFFALGDDDTSGKVDIVWDRASMVAINPELRAQYVQTLLNIVKPGGAILLVAFDRREGTDEAKASGPPFSVPESEVQKYYGNQESVESIQFLEEIDELLKSPESKDRWEKMGLKSLFETCYWIQIKK